jgi:hypothetical protein
MPEREILKLTRLENNHLAIYEDGELAGEYDPMKITTAYLWVKLSRHFTHIVEKRVKEACISGKEVSS